MDAGVLVGLLADGDRRVCWAAVQLGASTADAVAAATGLPATTVAKALGRLAAGGLVVSSSGALTTADGVFEAAARDALSRPESGEHAHQPDDVRKVLRAFVVDGRITQIPSQGAKRRLLLDWVAQDFEPGRHYTEAMVNLILGKRHADTAALRRYLVDDNILDRADGEYWRSGGTVASAV